nr:uncharacterized protein LOC126054403 [Helicoverpa armigera]
MDETEIKLEFHNNDNQCRVCLTVGRKLSPLGQYYTIFRRIISEFHNLNQLLLEDIRLCWECIAFLQRARIFQKKVLKANEVLQMGQRYMYGTQSSLTTVLLNDIHPHTVYINDCTLRLDVKTCDDENDEISEQYDDICELNEAEDSVKIEEEVKEKKEQPQQQKPKNNRWAKKRALQNKKPKFKIITEYSKDYFRKIEIDNRELPLFMQSERDSEYFKSKRFKCEKCVLVFSSDKFLEKHDNKYHNKVCMSFL